MKISKNIELDTVEKIKKYALNNYNNGLDIIVECWDDKELQELIDEGRESVVSTLETFMDTNCERTPMEGWDY